MQTVNRKTQLREALRQQRHAIFGNRRYWFHIFIWLIVVLYIFMGNNKLMVSMGEGLTVSGEETVVRPGPYLMVAGAGAGVVVAAVMVYFFLLFVIPFARYRQRKRYLWLGLFTIILLWVIIIFLSAAIAGYMGKFSSGERSRTIFIGLSSGVTLILTSLFFSLYYFIDLYDQQQHLNRYALVFADQLQAETNFLKTQINPHFLFNTLNNIYSLTLHKSDDAPRITLQLKQLINYMVNDCSQDKVPLAGEIDFIKNYIALEQLRNKEDKTVIDLDIQGDPEDRQIAPLLLINFIENAFKHGVKAGIEISHVKIRLFIMNKVLAMDVSNSKPLHAAKKTAVKQDKGIGIKNVQRRLELLYPDRYKLRISQSAREFNVHLNINL